jgi:hypothetical protein
MPLHDVGMQWVETWKYFHGEEQCKILEGNWWKLEGISTGKDHIRFWKAIGGNLKVLPRGRTI